MMPMHKRDTVCNRFCGTERQNDYGNSSSACMPNFNKPKTAPTIFSWDYVSHNV